MAKSTRDIEREIRQALDQCKVSARGLWHEMRYLIEKQSDRPGHLQRNGRPVSDGQLALAAGCPSKRIARLLQDLTDVGLIERSGHCLLAPRLARIAEIRSKRTDLTRLWRKRGCRPRKRGRGSRLEAAPAGVSRDTHVDPCVNQLVTRLKTGAPAPALSPSPGPLSPNPPTTPLADAAHPPSAGEPPPGARTGKTRKNQAGNSDPVGDSVGVARTRSDRESRVRKTTDEQLAVKEQFDEWYVSVGFPSMHEGVTYPAYDPADAAAVWKMLRSKEIHWNFDRAQALALFFLNEPEFYGVVGHRLRELGNRLGRYLTKWQEQQRRGRGQYGTNGQHVVRRGGSAPGGDQFIGARRKLPEVVAGSVGGGGGAGGGAGGGGGSHERGAS